MKSESGERREERWHSKISDNSVFWLNLLHKTSPREDKKNKQHMTSSIVCDCLWSSPTKRAWRVIGRKRQHHLTSPMIWSDGKVHEKGGTGEGRTERANSILSQTTDWQGIVGKCNPEVGGATMWTSKVMSIYVIMSNIGSPFQVVLEL